MSEEAKPAAEKPKKRMSAREEFLLGEESAIGDITSFENAESARILARFKAWMHEKCSQHLIGDTDYAGCTAFKFEDSVQAAKKGFVKALHFMDNWVTVFNAFVLNSDIDEFGMIAKVFSASADVVFNPVAIILGTVLTIYKLFLVSVQARINPDDDLLYTIEIVFDLVILMYFLWGRFIYKGSLLSSRKPHEELSFNHEVAVAYDVIRKKACPGLKCGAYDVVDDSIPVNKENPLTTLDGDTRFILETQVVPERVPFYQMLNIATKYCVWTSPDHGVDEEITVSMTKTGGGMEFIEGSCMYVRVALIFVFSLNIFSLFYHFKSAKINCNMEDESDRAECRASTFFLVATLGGILSLIRGLIVYSGITVVFAGLALSGSLAHELCESWLHRFAALRRFKGPDEADKGEENLQLKDMMRLAPAIKQDAFERYLFIGNFMKVSSGQWEFFLMTLFFVGVGLVVVTYEQASGTINSENLRGAIKTLASLVGEVLVFSMPFYSIAIANLRVDDIKAIFANTSPGDFVSIGGVAAWQGFMTASPLYWTCFGVPITFTVMKTYATTVVGFIPLITIFIKSLSSL